VPATQLTMRTSERGSLKACAQQWYWGQVEGLEPMRSANPLWFGSAIHEGLADFYRRGTARGPHPSEAFDKFLEGERSMIVTNNEEEAEYVNARQLGHDMLNRYVDFYQGDPSWDVIATERTFRVNIPRPERKVFGVTVPKQAKWLRYVGTWDGVYRDLDTGEIWLMEHKTAASIVEHHLALDDQAGSYWALATIVLRKSGVLKPDEDIAGIMYNFLRKAPDDKRPMNADGLYTNLPKKDDYVAALTPLYELTGAETLQTLQELANDSELTVLGEPSKSQPPPYFQRVPVYRSKGERKNMIRRIQDEGFFAEAYRSGDLPITKAPDKQRCSWCPFKRMCELDESGDQYAVEEFKESQFRKRNPYADHVKKSAG
jgi:hypothetical protein